MTRELTVVASGWPCARVVSQHR